MAVAQTDPIRVLVVDDVAAIRDLIGRVLGGDGYLVDTASNLAEAAGRDPASYDVVLVDNHLGDERGTELVETLIAEDPDAKGRCVVMTGEGRAAAPEGVAVLAKPFDAEQLADVVRAATCGGTTPEGKTGPRAAGSDHQGDTMAGAQVEPGPAGRARAHQPAAWPPRSHHSRARA